VYRAEQLACIELFKFEHRGPAERPIVDAMMRCCYCEDRAEVIIPSTPGHVCLAHAIEYWTGLSTYVKQLSEPRQAEATSCKCWECNQLSARRAAIAAPRPASHDTESAEACAAS
jgi:hypothetical protein